MGGGFVRMRVREVTGAVVVFMGNEGLKEGVVLSMNAGEGVTVGWKGRGGSRGSD